VTAILLSALVLFSVSVFDTPERANLGQFASTMATLETTPITSDERLQLYDALEIIYSDAADSIERVYAEEGNNLDLLLDRNILAIEAAHKKRVREGIKRIRKQKIKPKQKTRRIKKMRQASYKRFLREETLVVKTYEKQAAALRSVYLGAEESVRTLQERALQSIDIRPDVAEDPIREVNPIRIYG
jgi:hypothetical protein